MGVQTKGYLFVCCCLGLHRSGTEHLERSKGLHMPFHGQECSLGG